MYFKIHQPGNPINNHFNLRLICKVRRGSLTWVRPAFASWDEKAEGTIWRSGELQQDGPVRESLSHTTHRAHCAGPPNVLYTQGTLEIPKTHTDSSPTMYKWYIIMTGYYIYIFWILNKPHNCYWVTTTVLIWMTVFGPISVSLWLSLRSDREANNSIPV